MVCVYPSLGSPWQLASESCKRSLVCLSAVVIALGLSLAILSARMDVDEESSLTWEVCYVAAICDKI
jgi:hypothetical protein